MRRSSVSYSEAFKQQVVSEIERGKFNSINQARQAYGIRGGATVGSWVRRYGHRDLIPKKVRIQTLAERDQLKKAQERIRQLEAALADATIDRDLESSFLEIACERMGIDSADFKKNNVTGLSKTRDRKRDIS